MLPGTLVCFRRFSVISIVLQTPPVRLVLTGTISIRSIPEMGFVTVKYSLGGAGSKLDPSGCNVDTCFDTISDSMK
jgi:hypothetical protein